MPSERIKSWPEKWRRVGRQEGFAKGLEEGREKSRQEGEERHALQVARRMIELTTMGDEKIAEIAGLTAARVAELRREAGH